ncbi:MAG: hypothetical protein C0511_15275 [Hyphomicrobium sp.]|nr:hypothetical protein [Hyphomicrobium sp.]
MAGSASVSEPRLPLQVLSARRQALAAPGLFGLPSGVVHGLQASAAGLALVFLSQLALAVFDNANATRNLLAIERAKADL